MTLHVVRRRSSEASLLNYHAKGQAPAVHREFSVPEQSSLSGNAGAHVMLPVHSRVSPPI